MSDWRRIHLCTGILIRDERLLLVASRYPNHAQPLWNLPGGRQENEETIGAALVREFREETGLTVRSERLRYVSESRDTSTRTHFTNFAFVVEAEGEPAVPPGDLHAVDCAWVPLAEVPDRLTVAVVREPLRAVLGGSDRTYFGYDEAGITIAFHD